MTYFPKPGAQKFLLKNLTPAEVSIIETTLNSLLIKIISSGINTFFIQNILYHENQKRNSIPVSFGSEDLYISPSVFSETVLATSHVRTTDGFPVG
jgi:hypothetical protein